MTLEWKCGNKETYAYADHGVVDEKGRKVGGRATIWPGANIDEWIVEVHATRNGKLFGAIPVRGRQTVRGHVTTVAARALAEDLIEAQRKRYVKKYAERAKMQQWRDEQKRQ